MQLRRLFVSAVLSLICILISPVLSTDASWNVISADTATGLETSMANPAWFPRYASLTTGAAYHYNLYTDQPTTAPGTPACYFFRGKTGSTYRLGFGTAWGLIDIRSVVLTEAKTMYAGGYYENYTPNSFMQIHTMAYDTGSGLYTQSNWVTNAGFNQAITKLVYEAGATSYLYYLRNAAPLILRRVDITTPIGSGTTITPVSSPTISNGVAHSTQIRQQHVLVWGRSSTNMQFVDKTTMALTTTLTGSVDAWYFSLDNLDLTITYAIKYASPYGLYRIPIPASGTTYAQTASTGSTASINSNILNFGPYQYIGLVRWELGTKPFQMYNKLTLTTAAVPLPTINGLTNEGYTLVQGPSEGNKFFLAYQYTPAGYNFQSYYIQFDLCTDRTPGGQHSGGTCSTCPAGYYLSQVGVAGNQCYPNGWGISIGGSILVPCADTNCLECPTSSTICRKCAQGPPKYYSQGTDPTTCVTTAPLSKFGIDATTFLYVACSDPNCLNCAASNTVCTACDAAARRIVVGGGCACDSANKYAEVGSVCLCDQSVGYAADGSGTCVCDQLAGFTDDGFGGCICDATRKYVSTGGGTCQCDAAAGYTREAAGVCICDNSRGFYNYLSVCTLMTALPAGLGIDLSSNQVRSCIEPKCKDCQSDYSKCLEFQTDANPCNLQAGYTWDGTACKQKSSLDIRKGVDLITNTVKNCAVNNCQSCVDDYTICKFCTPGAVPSADGKSCGPPADEAAAGPLDVIVRWDPQARTLHVKFTFEPTYIPYASLALQSIRITEHTNSTTFNLKQLGAISSLETNGLTIQLSKDFEIFTATMVLSTSDQFGIYDTKTKMAFVKYPIIIDGISILKPDQATLALASAITTLASTRPLVTAAIVSFNPMLSVLLDYMFAELEILKLYDGPAMAYPDFILKAQYLDGLIPLEYDNFLESGIEDNPECTISPELSANGVTCLFLDNYGKNVIALFGYLGLALLLYILNKVLLAVCQQRSWLTKLSQFLCARFGFVMFHAKMEGEKFNHIFFITVGLHFRSLSQQSYLNMAYMVMTYIYFWTVCLLVVLLNSEVYSVFRSPALAKMLEEHKKNFIKLLGVEEDSKRELLEEAARSRKYRTGKTLMMQPTRWEISNDALPAKEEHPVKACENRSNTAPKTLTDLMSIEAQPATPDDPWQLADPADEFDRLPNSGHLDMDIGDSEPEKEQQPYPKHSHGSHERLISIDLPADHGIPEEQQEIFQVAPEHFWSCDHLVQYGFCLLVSTLLWLMQ